MHMWDLSLCLQAHLGVRVCASGAGKRLPWASTFCSYLLIPRYAVCRSDELGKLWSRAAAQLEALYEKIDKKQTAGQ